MTTRGAELRTGRAREVRAGALRARSLNDRRLRGALVLIHRVPARSTELLRHGRCRVVTGAAGESANHGYQWFKWGGRAPPSDCSDLESIQQLTTLLTHVWVR